MTPTCTRKAQTTTIVRGGGLSRRGLLATAAVAAGGSAIGSARSVVGQATPASTPAGGTVTIDIPGERVFPEGIAYDASSGLFYVGSTDDGTVFRGDLATGVVEPFLSGGDDDRTEVTGLKVDDAGRLVVCGRRTGRIFVYDSRTGLLLARYSNGRSDGTLINDAAISPDGVAYVTDSFAPVLYRVDLSNVPLGDAAEATPDTEMAERESEVFIDFSGSAFEYVQDDFNANGVVTSADGSILLIVQFATGSLYRVDVASAEVTEVALAGGDLRGGDGMALDGGTLYCLLDTTGELVRVGMNDDLTEGEIVGRFEDPSFNYPTTLALVGDGTALVVNSQLDMAGEGGEPTLPFTVSRIVLPM